MRVGSKNNKDFVVGMNIRGIEAGDVKLNHGLVEKRKVEKQFSYELRVGDERLINLFFVSMGNPHGVCWDNNLDKKTMKGIYGFLLEHKIFENGINVEFCKIISDHSISMTVFERGVGETLACGSGACAAVVSGILTGNLKSGSSIEVRLEKGSLFVEWSGKIRDPVFLQALTKKLDL
jgi:diaminopimelate epimerase